LLPCVSKTQYRRCADCADYRACELKKVFRSVRDSTAAILDGWTLADARGNGSLPSTHLGAPAGKKANRRSSVKLHRS
jgi:DNA-binding IscR family transcriptional regulator